MSGGHSSPAASASQSLHVRWSSRRLALALPRACHRSPGSRPEATGRGNRRAQPATGRSSWRRATTSASSATRSPTACSTTAGWRRSSTPASRSTTSSSATSASPATSSTLRLRSADFGTPDEWLAAVRRSRSRTSHERASVNERFEMTEHEGRRDLRLLRLQRVVRRRGRPAEVQERPRRRSSSTRSAQKYNGKIRPAARPVLADRARGPQRSPTCPTARRTTSASSCTPTRWPRSPRRNDVPFVDLFTPDAGAVRQGAAKPLTINGVHLNEHGNRQLAEVIDSALFGDGPTCRATATHLRAAPPGGPRQELLLVQPLPHDRRLLDLRRPGGPQVRRRPDQLRGRAARAGSPRRDDRQPRQA